MTRGARLTAVLGGAVLLLAVWVSSTDAVRLLRGAGFSRGEKFPLLQGNQHGGGRARRLVHPTGAPMFYLVMEWVVLSLTALALLVFVVSAALGMHRRRAEAARAVTGWEGVELGDIPDVPPAVVEAARRQLFALREGLARNAIVACWMELEQACRDNGFPRDASETSSEFVSRVLARFAVAETAVSSLAALYREARFSEHELGERHREAAIDALEQVSADLHRRATASAEEVTA